jgi:hypothetical protein
LVSGRDVRHGSLELLCRRAPTHHSSPSGSVPDSSCLTLQPVPDGRLTAMDVASILGVIYRPMSASKQWTKFF